VRLGRYYREWQTRRSVIENLRNWMESFGGEVRPVPYPDLLRAEYVSDRGQFASASRELSETEAIFTFLGSHCGSLGRSYAWRGSAIGG
jgi:hypothetical protein